MFRSSIVLAFLVALVPAQRGGEEGTVEEQARQKRQAIAEGADVKDNGEKGDPDNAWEKMTPEQRLNHNIRHGASAYCRFVMSVKPARLMPGQSGTLIVVATLVGQAVLPAPAPLEVLSAPQQGLVTLGSPVFRPASPGKLASASGYLGKPVYENYAIFEVPVTMSTEAVVGRKVPVALDFKFDLYDGVSTQPVGRFTDRAATEIEVGQVADPSVIAGGHVGRIIGPAHDETVEGTDAAAGSNAPGPKGKTVDAAAPLPAPVEATVPPVVPTSAGSSAPPADEDGGLPLPPALLIGGGVVLLVVLLLFAKRR